MYNYVTIIPQVLKVINDDYSQFLLSFIALITAAFAYKEFVLKSRPYIFPELQVEKIGDDWYFHFILNNSGSYPVIAKITEAKLTIGDENYPTQFNTEMLIPVSVSKKLAPIGHIKKLGRENINANKYVNNRVEIVFSIISKAVAAKSYKYLTKVKYQVDVFGENPVVHVISEEFK